MTRKVISNHRSVRRTAEGVAVILALVTAASATPDVGAAPVGGSTGPPNILVVMMDDQRVTGTLDVMPATRS